ncbi:dihydrolipoamide acetyltransferase family protein [Shouchella shacheensis]|uniref:dihydrolipoamide acetyltransferase family protein n=1 Tax=Shouchella shacheensis TaxID=1649580 RepID=UPI00073FEF7C|nr:dihydrolipoamide acetyltransferase family protein [Shouchella shacheensis]
MIEVKLHDIGEGMTEGEILHYFINVGDEVKVDQPLVEVQTDKVAAELSAPHPGRVKEILVNRGETVQVGTTLVVLEGEDEEPVAVAEEKNELSESRSQTFVTSILKTNEKPFRRVMAAPYTRKIARENDIDIEQVQGTGPSGRVTDEDVYAFIRYASEEKTAPKEPESQPQEKESKRPTTIPFAGRRKQIANKMTQSLFTIPHVTHFEEANLTKLMKWRAECRQAGIEFSLGAYFIKAVVTALQEFPIFNARLDEDEGEIQLYPHCHIGLATDAQEGLIVPVLKHAEEKSLRTIDQEMKALTKKAQENQLKPEELSGGTFTISNVGPLGSTGATPIINAPQTGLLAIHKTKKRPIVTTNDTIEIGHVMTLSMAFDHRVADGGTAVAFTNRWVELLEEPKRLIMELM